MPNVSNVWDVDPDADDACAYTKLRFRILHERFPRPGKGLLFGCAVERLGSEFFSDVFRTVNSSAVDHPFLAMDVGGYRVPHLLTELLLCFFC